MDVQKGQTTMGPNRLAKAVKRIKSIAGYVYIVGILVAVAFRVAMSTPD